MTSPFVPDDPRPPWSIAIVDDNAAVLEATSRSLEACGHHVSAYRSARALLQALRTESPEVVLLDLRLPEVDGSTLQVMLHQLGYHVPIVFLTAYGDVSESVRAIRRGAIDFLEKPCDETTLLAALGRGVRVARREQAKNEAVRQLATRWETLTRREREVCRWVVTGSLNKQIAAALGTVEKTIKVHRGRVMTKMGAQSVAELVRMFDQLSDAGRTDSATEAKPVRRRAASLPQAERASPPASTPPLEG